MALMKCTECGKEVSDKAPACIGCGAPLSPLTSSPRGSTTAVFESKPLSTTPAAQIVKKEVQPSTKKPTPSGANNTVDYGLPLLALPMISTMLILFWVSGMNLLQSPGNTLSMIALVTIVGTAILAAMEAGKAGMVTDKKAGSYSPTSWFFLILLMWAIGYPAYMYKRRKYELKNHLLVGVIVTAVFSGSFLLMSVTIEQKRAEVRGHFQDMQRNLEKLGT